MALMVKTLPANAEDTRIVCSIPESRRPLGVGNGKYSCLENPMDGEPAGLQSMELQRAGHD